MSYIAMRARKKRKPSQFLVPTSCCSDWLAACTHLWVRVPPGTQFFLRFFRFFFVSQCVGAFFEFFYTNTEQNSRRVCLKSVTPLSHFVKQLTVFFDYEFFEGRMTSSFNLDDFLELWIFLSDFFKNGARSSRLSKKSCRNH